MIFLRGEKVMNAMKQIKKILSDACVYFTAAEFLILLIATGFSEIDPTSGGGVGKFLSLGSAALIFAACLIMSALNLVFRLDFSTAVKVLIHFIGSLIAYSVVFIVIPGVWNNFGAIFVRLGVFAVIYAVIAGIAGIVASVKKNRKADDLEYESQFGEFFTTKKR